MPPRALWKGSISFGLVTVPINLVSATEAGETLAFHLLHRKRQWNAAQGKWMGWERKRGKLHELNRFLRGDANTSFIVDGAETYALVKDVRYVITLDADTRLPRGAAALCRRPA